MAAASGSSHRSSWPNLAPDLLGLVLARLPSHVDRVRVSAVCPAWRSSARLQRPLPQLLPWLGLRDGAFLSLPDGAVHRLPVVPDDVLCRVSTGSALYLVQADGTRSMISLSSSSSATTAPAVVVPEYFSFERITLHKYLAQSIRKAVVSDRLSAVLVRSKVRSSGTVMSTRKLQQRRSSTTSRSPAWYSLSGTNKVIADIAIFKGELYQLTTGQDLLVVLDHRRRRWETEKWCIRCWTQGYNNYPFVKKKYYLVVSGDQLLMVKRLVTIMPTFLTEQGIYKPASWFEVFEATNLRDGDGHGGWRKVENLSGRAIFISEGCSQSLPATNDSTIGPREDCIYFVTEGNNTSYSGEKIHETPFLDSGVYNMREHRMTPLPFETVQAAHRGPWSSTWIFPET